MITQSFSEHFSNLLLLQKPKKLDIILSLSPFLPNRLDFKYVILQANCILSQ